MIYDAIIIGTGPAGLSAALNLKLHEKQFLWLGNHQMSDKLQKAERIFNYPGLAAVDGKTLATAFQQQATAMGITISETMVTSILPFEERYAVIAQDSVFETHALLLATGVSFTGTLPGESELVGKGVSYCATCDGGLYRNKTIAVLCNNRRFESEVQYLANLAQTLYLLSGASDLSISAKNIRPITERAIAIQSDGQNQRVQSLKLQHGQELAVDGVFILRDQIAMQTLLPTLRMENGHIAVNRMMKTNLPGCFAAGDCTGRPYQYAKAVGEGNIAAHQLLEYLAHRSKGNA